MPGDNPFVGVATETNGVGMEDGLGDGPGMAAAVESNDPVKAEPFQIEGAGEQLGSASWPAAAYHTVTAVVGVGVLGLPWAFSYLGGVMGSILLFLSMLASLYSSWLLADLAEYDGKRHVRYRDIGSAVLGPRGAKLFVIPFQFCVLVGTTITYALLAAKAMQLIHQLTWGGNPTLVAYIFTFGALQLGLSQVPDFTHLWWVSIMGAAMSFLYSMLAGILAIGAAREDPDPVVYARPEVGWARWRGVLNAIGGVMFAYGGHSVLPEIQATLRTPPPSRDNMMKGVYIAYAISVVCYFFVALSGYASYGSAVADDVLLSSPRAGDGWVAFANVLVIIHLFASFQVFGQPIFENVETLVSARVQWFRDRPLVMRLILRSTYVFLVTWVAAVLPFFTELMGLIGAIGFTPMTFVMPSILWLLAKRDSATTAEFVLNAFIIVSFSLFGVMAFVGSVASIIEDYKTFDFWV